MFDVNQNSALQRSEFVSYAGDDPLVQACGEFWQLEKAKQYFVTGEGVVHLSSESSSALKVLQIKIANSLDRIRGLSVTNNSNFCEKLRVLKYLAAETDFQDPDLFRELVGVLDDWDVREFHSEDLHQKTAAEPTNTRRNWKLNLNNIFGFLTN